MNRLFSLLPTLVMLSCFGVSLTAQEVTILPRADRISTAAPVAKKSPMNSASMLTADGYVRVVYSQPMLRDRQMLGDQVPYGKLWRLGANEATELFTTAAIEIGGQILPAGAYSLFAIPNKDRWTLVFNSGLGQWGAYAYNADQDVLRVDAPVQTNDNSYEAFTTFFREDAMVMGWGKTLLEVPLRFVPATLED